MNRTSYEFFFTAEHPQKVLFLLLTLMHDTDVDTDLII